MSRRRNRKRRSAGDAYTNTAAGLGGASPLMAAAGYTRTSLAGDMEMLTVLYRENWIAKKIIDLPAEDMTRCWYTLNADLPADKLDDLARLEARHAVRREITDAVRWARLYGGSIALMVIAGEENRLDQPLDREMLLPGCFRGLLVLDRSMGIEPDTELVEDLDDPDFGLPAYYRVTLENGRQMTLHHSRVLRFIGRELPAREAAREQWWGAPELEHIREELQKRDTTSANIAQLVFQANVTTLKMSDYGELLAMGTDSQRARVLNAIETEDRLRTSFGMQVMSAGDQMEDHPYSFSGLAEVYESFMMDMAGASEIPATRLFGRSPAGMNATGESDLKMYYETIAQMQERMLRPALEKLLPVMAESAWGTAPPDLKLVFVPIATASPMEKAEVISRLTDAVIRAYEAGLVTREEAAAELKESGRETGFWSRMKGADDDVLRNPDLGAHHAPGAGRVPDLHRRAGGENGDPGVPAGGAGPASRHGHDPRAPGGERGVLTGNDGIL